MKVLIRIVSLATLGLVACSYARACLWDHDTVAFESKQFPDLVDVVTGRFPRYPPLYYSLRLDRVTQELKADPTRLEDYDDAAVSCDRLQNDDKALAWMARKRVEMKLLGAVDSEASYRLLANEGTFYAHKWIRGKDHRRVALLDHAIDDLTQAIKINPQAHFGREMIQVGVIEWLRDKAIASGKAVGNHGKDADTGSAGTLYAYLTKKGFTDEAIRKGISGLIVLGSAWESQDAFLTLMDTVPPGEASLRQFINLRVSELGPNTRVIDNADDQLLASVDASYKRLRSAAEAEQRRQDDYMSRRLGPNNHPDTNPSFWDEWAPTPRPQFIDPPLPVMASNYLFNHPVAFGVVLLGIVAGIVWGGVRLAKTTFRLVRKLARR